MIGRQLRLAAYRVVAHRAAAQGSAVISSGELAEQTLTSSAQVRRDLSAVFVASGRRGVGYFTGELVAELDQAIDWPTVVAQAQLRAEILDGIGELGRRARPRYERDATPTAVPLAPIPLP
jgi:NADH/NAD ratio-sensing transcriptional regulator Rex